MVDLCPEKLVYLVIIPRELVGRTFRDRALAEEADHRLAVLPERSRELHGEYGLVLVLLTVQETFGLRVAGSEIDLVS